MWHEDEDGAHEYDDMTRIKDDLTNMNWMLEQSHKRILDLVERKEKQAGIFALMSAKDPSLEARRNYLGMKKHLATSAQKIQELWQLAESLEGDIQKLQKALS